MLIRSPWLLLLPRYPGCCGFCRRNQCWQNVTQTIVAPLPQAEIQLAIQGIQLVISTLCGGIRCELPVRRANFILCFLDGLESAGSQESKNCRSKTHNTLARNQ